MRRAAFTLVELLVVIAIIAMLAAFLFPVFVTARSAVHQMGVSSSAKQLSLATGLYLADHDDTYPLAMYEDGGRVRAWFGKHVGDDQDFDHEQGILSGYVKERLSKDPTLVAQRYFGDWSGIGYNWGVVGSDFHLKGDYSTWPNCERAARATEFEDPSGTVVFATSVFHSVPWTGGDGGKYLFGFFDPPSFWHGVPNIDFRHLGETKVDKNSQKVTSTGNAVVAWADGSTGTRKQGELKDEFFWRNRNPWGSAE